MNAKLFHLMTDINSMCHFKLNPEIILLTADLLYMKTWIPLTNIVALGRGGDFSSKTNLVSVTTKVISTVWCTIQCSFVLYSNIDRHIWWIYSFRRERCPSQMVFILLQPIQWINGRSARDEVFSWFECTLITAWTGDNV